MVKKKPIRRRYRAVTHREKKFNKTYNDLGKRYLSMADEIWKSADGLDTAVRDTVAEGLAHIVNAGYDCLAQNLDLTIEGWMSFIDGSTADWFRNRGFAEWFCVGAANGFRQSRPRALSEIFVKVRRVRQRKPRAKQKRTPEAE